MSTVSYLPYPIWEIAKHVDESSWSETIPIGSHQTFASTHCVNVEVPKGHEHIGSGTTTKARHMIYLYDKRQTANDTKTPTVRGLKTARVVVAVSTALVLLAGGVSYWYLSNHLITTGTTYTGEGR